LLIHRIEPSPLLTHPERLMPTIQLRHVPDDLHRKLKARAAIEGRSLSDYLVREIRQLAEKPTMSEMMERLARRKPVHLKTSPAEMVQAMRDGHDRD
jgi:antitoxin FitA